MDCLNIYEHFYKKAQDVSKRMIIAEMQKAKFKNRPFLTLHNKIIKNLHNYIKTNFTNNLELNFKESYSIFQKKYTYYEGTESEKVKWILEDEIIKAFKKNQTSSYSSFIADLAVETSLRVALNHYNNYRNYYQLIYHLNKYEYFVFHDFKGIAFESSEYFKIMMDEKYPHKVKEREQKLKMLALQSTTKKETKNITTKSKSDKEQDIMELLDSFTDEEKFLIIHVINNLISKSLSIPVTDLMKLARIAGTYEDLSIFYMSPREVTPYSKVSKGIDYYKGDKQRKIIDSTILKLSTFKIDVVNNYLVGMKTKYLQNKVNIRKA
ncbi:hypothetical protein [Winogradskyella sp. PE311]|uniref:hypothetical protein n=1 Tax=Winogradskyella sp. PE311 TaxID=3366943 RepID=UPI003980DB50